MYWYILLLLFVDLLEINTKSISVNFNKYLKKLNIIKENDFKILKSIKIKYYYSRISIR